MYFYGYKRLDGKVGIRNHILVLPTVSCANRVSELIGKAISGAIVITHQHGCGNLGHDRDQVARTLIGTGRNPNVAAVLVVGLGCEAVSVDEVVKGIEETGKPVFSVIIQEEGGSLKAIAKGSSFITKLAESVYDIQRERFCVEHLVIGTECGGSDTTSGIFANPALGKAADMMIDNGAKVILSETTEFLGAEHLLAKRAKTPEIAAKLLDIVNHCEKEIIRSGFDLRGTQPSPGNITGGLTSIEEKSLGCIYKGGSRQIAAVIDYAEEVNAQGLTVMNTPGFDVESVTGMVAGGAQIVVFTTGQGTPTGNPIAPVIKITGNSNTWGKMADNIDIYAGDICEGKVSFSEIAHKISHEIIQVASGKKTKSEILGHQEFAIYRLASSV